jgi:hypothetical protein
MDFSEALELLKAGKKVRRERGWVSTEYVAIGMDEFGSVRFVEEGDCDRPLWPDDIVADDWIEVE